MHKAIATLIVLIAAATVFPVVLAAQPSDPALDAQLVQAVRAGDAEQVKDLLSRGANSGGSLHQNEQPIVTAARLGNKEMVRLLLEFGACIGSGGPDRRTPLETALYAPDGDIAAWETTHRDVVWFLLNVINAAKRYTAYEGVINPTCAGDDHGNFGTGQWCSQAAYCDLLEPAMERIDFEGSYEAAQVDVDAIFIIGNLPRRGWIQLKNPEEQAKEIREKRHQIPR